MILYLGERRKLKKWAGKARRRARKEARQLFDRACGLHGSHPAVFRLWVQERRKAGRASVCIAGKVIGGWNVRPSRWPE